MAALGTTIRQRLWAAAVNQDGFITQADADALGLRPNILPQLAHRGKLTRRSQGVYQFGEFPQEQRADYRFATLWTGRESTVLSHDTALEVLELCNINPDKFHVTVPRGARVRREGGELIVVHYGDLDGKTDVGWWQEIPCVKAATAIRQGIETKVPAYLLYQALETARARGAIADAQYAQLTFRLEDHV
jgi:predicted transcriptional regulator of viral defense system